MNNYKERNVFLTVDADIRRQGLCARMKLMYIIPLIIHQKK